MWRSIRLCKFFLHKKIEIRRSTLFGLSCCYFEFIMHFWSRKSAETYYQYLKFAITAHFDHSTLLTLELKTKTHIITRLIMTRLKSNPNLIKIQSQPCQNPNTLWIADRVMIGNRRLYYYSLSLSIWSLRMQFSNLLSRVRRCPFPFPFTFSCFCGAWKASAIFHTWSQERSLFVLPAPGKPGLNPGVLRTSVPNNVLIMS